MKNLEENLAQLFDNNFEYWSEFTDDGLICKTTFVKIVAKFVRDSHAISDNDLASINEHIRTNSVK